MIKRTKMQKCKEVTQLAQINKDFTFKTALKY